LCKDVFSRVGNFLPNNNSAEDGIDGTNGYFRWNAGCYPERKTLGILFQGTKIKANSLNSVLYSSAEEKTTQNSLMWNKKEANSQYSVPNHSAEENTARNSTDTK
jgi:hypothetical protein